jgi:uncharacterized protein YcfL
VKKTGEWIEGKRCWWYDEDGKRINTEEKDTPRELKGNKS